MLIKKKKERNPDKQTKIINGMSKLYHQFVIVSCKHGKTANNIEDMLGLAHGCSQFNIFPYIRTNIFLTMSVVLTQ